ncbi:MAG: nicotinate (nicotinamide) nucleotide adenylyltransferase [Spirochaetaceae bacterium]|nr:MAG: nicotinate (nicotinamide) nucleotide adenylyltransferase [Spirochaetaceae bacterium]
MRFAILGGTFNPVHNGHLNVAAEVRSRFLYDRILFIPANIPAHKTMEVDVGAAHRLKMLELAVSRNPDFVVEDCELRRGGTSYTIDTVRDLSARYPIDGKPGLIIGDDLVEDFETWRDVEQLVQRVELIIAHRQSPHRVRIAYPCRYVDNSLFPISSSQIRQDLKEEREAAEDGRSVRDWLPPDVFDYIQRHDLYR